MPAPRRAPSRIDADCVIAGGGPAGLMLGLLLARAGVDVVVLEKHADFLRDFRGDTIHPSTQEALHELGLLDEFLALPHADTERITVTWHGEEGVIADFSRLPLRRRVITFMPQWDFLDLLARAGEQEAPYRLLRSTRVEGLLRDADRVTGVRAVGPDGPLEVRARLVVGADGRDSRVRERAGLVPRGKAAGMDVLWFRLPKRAGERHPFVQAGAGMIIAIDRGDFLQVAHVIPAGGWQGSAADLARMRDRIARISPRLSEAVSRLTPSDVHLLRVRIERLRRWWSEGLLCIGDAAHAMSPAGGVGINLALQDAIAAARILTPTLHAGGAVPGSVLRRVQRRRAFPTIVTQAIQRRMQAPLLAERAPGAPLPLMLRLLRDHPRLTHLTGRFVGMGVRPERIGR
ncbi:MULTISPECIES: FAD-dependent oxidoreductase [unclassified Microbacterium]|uniref:FAD-dependent oxidoreductase n=1 Tax=Microbacterium TaxID=33882 RepID=UPI003BA05D7E